MVAEIGIDLNLQVDPQQVGWVSWREGDARLKAKVVKSRSGELFISIPSVYRRGISVYAYDYEDKGLWEQKKKILLEEFRLAVGDDFFYNLGHEPSELPTPRSGSIKRFGD